MSRQRSIPVRVSRDHIDCGERGEPAFCPIALALREVTDISWIRVSGQEIHWTDNDMNWCEADTPRIAREFLHQFDSGERVKPMRFELEFREEKIR